MGIDGGEPRYKKDPTPDVGRAGELFGLDHVSDEDADLVVVPVRWDVTTSYRPGTSAAPDAILAASSQIDYYDPIIEDTTAITYAMSKRLDYLKNINKELRPKAERIIAAQEEGKGLDGVLEDFLTQINAVCTATNKSIQNVCKDYLDQGKMVVLLGGDHSTPLGYMRALAERNEEYGVLHFDAHADLRKAYEGFDYSHASIMRNVMDTIPQVTKLVQVGIRDVSEAEIDFADTEGDRISMYQDQDLSERLFEGETWKQITDEIVSKLPGKVYISFDIDGLDPKLCPNTGTPVPGGLGYEQALYIIRRVVESGKTIIGADLNEVGVDQTGASEWDAVVGMRLLFQLCTSTALSQGKLKRR